MSGGNAQPANRTSGLLGVPKTRFWFGTAGILAMGLIAGGYLPGDGLLRAKDGLQSVQEGRGGNDGQLLARMILRSRNSHHWSRWSAALLHCTVHTCTRMVFRMAGNKHPNRTSPSGVAQPEPLCHHATEIA